MKLHKLLFGLVLVGAWTLGSRPALSQEKKPDPPKPVTGGKADEKKDAGKPGGGEPSMGGMTPEQMAETEAWMKAGTPGPEHKLLEYMVGTFNVTGKMWDHRTPDAPPSESTGVSKCEWFNDGRFTKYDYKGEMMGGPFNGWGFSGYDNIDKKYVSIWMDSWSTGIFHYKGTYDPATKAFTFQGEMKEPSGKVIKDRQVIKVVSNDEHTMTFYHTRDGKEAKAFELVYKRAK